MKNIVFDLGGVLFARHTNNYTPEFRSFFDFIRAEKMPFFWEEYDRGTKTFDEVADILAEINNRTPEQCRQIMQHSIDIQEPVKPTEELIRDLKAAGYKLYVLSNMSREFIAFLRQFPVYRFFDGEVVSCEEGTVKPEARIYEILLERYGLDPAQTLFIDDRAANLRAAEQLGIQTQLFNHNDPAETCEELRRRLL